MTQISQTSKILKVFVVRLLHLWVKACVGLTMPLHLDTSLKEVPISLTYTPDIAQAKTLQGSAEGFHGALRLRIPS